MNGTTPSFSRRFFLNNNAVRTVLVYAVAAAALFWVFHDVKVSVLIKELANISWPLAVLGMVIDIGRYVTQSVRWNFLIRPFGKISVAKTFQALYAGIFLNLLLPFRMGEVARAYLASRFSGARFPSIVSSMFVEYLFDGIWLAVGIGAIALVAPLPGHIMFAARILGVAVLIAVSLFVFILFFRRGKPASRSANTTDSRWKPLGAFLSFLDTIRSGMQAIGMSGLFWASLGVSALDIMFHIVAFWIIMIAYGINMPFINAAIILLFVFVGLIIPNAPSNVGSFQFLCVLGLLAFGVDKTTAGGFSLLFFVLVLVPQIAIGSIAFAMSGEKLFEIKRHLASFRLSIKE
jgi:uncharacterized protein (TIRG00374 family)